MSSLILKFLDSENSKEIFNQKIKLNSKLRKKGKLILLDRMVISYIRDYKSYENDSKIVNYLNEVKKLYDRSCNIISLTNAFYEGGKGNFETSYEKAKSAQKHLTGINDFFKYAQVDENFLKKNSKKAIDAYVYDSSVQWRNNVYPYLIKKTFEHYIFLTKNEFSNSNVLICIEKLLQTIVDKKLSIGEPICQYCLALLTKNDNAKKLFKVKGISKKNPDEISKLIHNVYADLRVISVVSFIQSRLLGTNIEVVFETYDNALKQYLSEFKLTRNWTDRLKNGQTISSYSIDMNLNLFRNMEIFNNKNFFELEILFRKFKDIK
jgi:hypothetical protein